MRSLALLFLLACMSRADDGPTLESLYLGKVVLGPEVKTEELKGKVVLVEEWGLH